MTSASSSKENKMSEIVQIESSPSSHPQKLVSRTGEEVRQDRRLSAANFIPTFSQVCESECESETEDMEMENQEEVEAEEAEEEMEDIVPETETEEAVVSLLPSETLDRKESVELWKSRNETDVIVSDHDVFGLHEGEEDSLDSLVLRPDIDSSYDLNDDTTMSSDILISSLGQLVSQNSALLDHEQSESSARPKRKSGSLSELTLPGSLPLKKQRPESLSCPSQEPGDLLETPESGGLDCDEGLNICDTAPTSPRSPPAVQLGPGPRCQGRSLIPDRENPPLEMLSWVSTFSRWSHAERLLAINQLIER